MDLKKPIMITKFSVCTTSYRAEWGQAIFLHNDIFNRPVSELKKIYNFINNTILCHMTKIYT
jgi:hypothetical protein